MLARALKTQTGEQHGRADSITRSCDADSHAHRRLSRRSLCLSERQALATLLPNAARVSLLRHSARAGGGVEPQISTRKRYLQSVAENFCDQSEFRRYSSRLWCTRRAQCRTDLLGGTGEGRAHVSSVRQPG